MAVTDKCKNEASVVYAWGGKVLRACPEHLKAISAVSHAIGGVLEPRPLPPGQSCEHSDDLEPNTLSK